MYIILFSVVLIIGLLLLFLPFGIIKNCTKYKWFSIIIRLIVSFCVSPAPYQFMRFYPAKLYYLLLNKSAGRRQKKKTVVQQKYFHAPTSSPGGFEKSRPSFF